MVLPVATHFVVKKCWNSLLMKDALRSEWTYAGIHKKEKSEVRHMITMLVNTSGQGKTNGNLEYSSTWHHKEVLVLLLVSGGGFEINVDPLKCLECLDKGDILWAVELRFAFTTNRALACNLYLF